jgi:hypothetical protein
MEVQHITLKMFAQEPAGIDLADAIPVFHRWIQNGVTKELLIDVADYRHVPAGPGVMLVGFEANYSLDLAEERLGLLYNRKKADEGSTREKLQQVYEAALAACRRLESEPEFRGRLKFDSGECEVILNDRLLAPNTEESFRALQPDLEQFFAAVWGAGDFDLDRVGEPRGRLRVRASARRTALRPV